MYSPSSVGLDTRVSLGLGWIEWISKACRKTREKSYSRRRRPAFLIDNSLFDSLIKISKELDTVVLGKNAHWQLIWSKFEIWRCIRIRCSEIKVCHTFPKNRFFKKFKKPLNAVLTTTQLDCATGTNRDMCITEKLRSLDWNAKIESYSKFDRRILLRI